MFTFFCLNFKPSCLYFKYTVSYLGQKSKRSFLKGLFPPLEPFSFLPSFIAQVDLEFLTFHVLVLQSVC